MYEVTHVFDKAATAAHAKWRGWAEEIAAGGKTPPMNELVEVATLLNIDHAARELERDASAIMEVRQLDEQAEGVQLAIRERLTVEGGPDGIKEKLAAAQREVERLKKLRGTCPMHYRLAELGQRAATIRKARPRVFAPQEKRSKMETTSATKKAPKKKAVKA
jgi:hypothetical protein